VLAGAGPLNRPPGQPSAAAKSKHLREYPVAGTLVPGIPAELLEGTYEVRERALRLLFVGRLEIHKGALAAFAVFRRLAADFPGITLLYLGDGAARGALLREIRQAGLEDRVQLAGAVPPEQVLRRDAAGRPAALPEPERESSPDLIGSAGGGIAARRLGCSRNPGGGACGAVLLPPEDEAGWAGAVWGLLADRERRVYLSTAGRDWAAGFTWERSVETLEGALRLAVGRGAAV